MDCSDYRVFRYLFAFLAFLCALIWPALSAAETAPKYPDVKTDVREFRTFAANDPNPDADSVTARAKLRHRMLPGGRSKYASVAKSIPVTKIRNSAVKALGRGKIHPALLTATVAADLLLDEETGEIMKEEPPETAPNSNVISVEEGTDINGPANEDNSNCAYGTAEECLEETDDAGPHEAVYQNHIGGWNAHKWSCPSGSTGVLEGDENIGCLPSSEVDDGPTEEPLSEEELEEQLDPHIATVSDDLARQISEDPESEWSKDTASDPAIESDQGLPQSLRDAAKKQAQNAAADSAGDERPNPDTETDTQTSGDETLDELTESPTNFPDEPEPEWDVEMYGPEDLEEKDVDVAAAQCPEPYSFTVNVGGMVKEEITIPYTEICTFAERVNPFFLAGAWVMAGFIVIRR